MSQTQVFQLRLIFWTSFIIIIGTGNVEGKLPPEKNKRGGGNLDMLEFFATNNLGVTDFLSRISGTIKFGNQTFHLPQDLAKLLGQEMPVTATRRQFDEEGSNRQYEEPWTIEIKPEQDWERDEGWGWIKTGYKDKDKKDGAGLLSFGNFLRAGCIIMDVIEIKKSVKNGLF